jgi:hypothetical protein
VVAFKGRQSEVRTNQPAEKERQKQSGMKGLAVRQTTVIPPLAIVRGDPQAVAAAGVHEL